MKTAANVPSSARSLAPTGKRNQISRFLAACLAPLPEGEKPADTPQFRRVLERDRFVAWDAAKEQVEYFAALHKAAAIRQRHAKNDRLQIECFEAYARSAEAKRRLCLVPAPSAKEWKYKVRHLDWAADDAGKRQIEADRQRFEGEYPDRSTPA